MWSAQRSRRWAVRTARPRGSRCTGTPHPTSRRSRSNGSLRRHGSWRAASTTWPSQATSSSTAPARTRCSSCAATMASCGHSRTRAATGATSSARAPDPASPNCAACTTTGHTTCRVACVRYRLARGSARCATRTCRCCRLGSAHGVAWCSSTSTTMRCRSRSTSKVCPPTRPGSNPTCTAARA